MGLKIKTKLIFAKIYKANAFLFRATYFDVSSDSRIVLKHELARFILHTLIANL